MIAILQSFQGNYIVLFIISFFVFSIWEYFVGWLLEKAFHAKYWDYSYYKFQIKGRVCLVNSLTWGFLGVAFTELIHPAVVYVIEKIPVGIINWGTAIASIWLIIDLTITVIKMKNIDLKLNSFKELTDTIKEKIEELKVLPKKAKSRIALQTAINELKQGQAELKEAVEKQTRRMRNAFPSMKWEKLNELLKKRVELKKQKKNNPD